MLYLNEDPVIVTKKIPASNVLGTRISAKSDSGAVYVPYDHALNIVENHLCAVEKYCHKFYPGRKVRLVPGGNKHGYSFSIIEISGHEYQPVVVEIETAKP